jgi:hypothetical protein
MGEGEVATLARIAHQQMLFKAVKVLERLRAPAAEIASAFGISVLPKSSAPAPMRVPSLRTLLIEDPDGIEGATAARAVHANGLQIELVKARTSECQKFAPLLRAGICMPVGSPAFIRACMGLAGIQEPKWTCYPRELSGHMLQEPRRMTVEAALAGPRPIFLKPVFGRPFTGFILRPDGQMDASAQRQLDAMQQLSAGTSIWSARALAVASEWRYYVLYGEVIGFAHYFPLADAARAKPEIEEISTIIAAIPHDAAYALDVAVLESGESTVIGVRDAWALELVGEGAQRPEAIDYLRLLWTRWAELILEARDRAAANSLPQGTK